MADSYAKIKFKDGNIMYANYQNTSDCLGNKLYNTREECTGDNYFDYDTECKHEEEEVVIATHYGKGSMWTGKACRKCNRITFDFDSWEELIDCDWGFSSLSDEERKEQEEIKLKNWIKHELPDWY